MFDKKYFEDLKRFVGMDLNLSEEGDSICINTNWEMQHGIDFVDGKYKFFYCERGRRYDDGNPCSEKWARYNFATLLRSAFRNKVHYEYIQYFYDIESEEVFIDRMKKYCDAKFYSMYKPKRDAINLEKREDGSYRIYRIDENGKEVDYKIFDKNVKISEIYFKFYCDVTSYMHIRESQIDYEEYFGVRAPRIGEQ